MIRIPSFNSKGSWFYLFQILLLFFFDELDEKIIFHGQIFQTNCSQRITSLRRRGLSGSPNQVAQGERDLESLKLSGQKCKAKFCPFSPTKLFPKQLSWGYHLIIFSLGKVPFSQGIFCKENPPKLPQEPCFGPKFPREHIVFITLRVNNFFIWSLIEKLPITNV